MGARGDAEEAIVRDIGERFGYGRVMQLCEQIWNKKTPGASHSVGPCVGLLVPCPHQGYADAVACDWCCGSGRVTQRVLRAQQDALL